MTGYSTFEQDGSGDFSISPRDDAGLIVENIINATGCGSASAALEPVDIVTVYGIFSAVDDRNYFKIPVIYCDNILIAGG